MTKRTPILEVSHLPSAASYYASLTQPLGLVFLFASNPHSTPSPLASLHYGFTPPDSKANTVVFSVQQSPTTSARPSIITLEAPSPQAVVDFHRKGELLNKGFKGHTIEHIPKEDTVGGKEEVLATTRDFDGNMIEARYQSRGAGSMISSTSTEKEARRVLEWQEDVARSVRDGQSQVSGSGYGDRPASLRRAETFPMSVRRETTTTTDTYHHHAPPVHAPSPPPAASSTGISGKTILGTLIGAAAGAAVAYAMVRSESPEPVAPAPRQSPPAHHTVSYIPSPSYTHHRQHQNVVERIPARSFVSERSEQRTVTQDNIRPRYVAQYTLAAAPNPPSAISGRELERIEEGSYISRRSGRSHASQSQASRRSRSQDVGGSRYEKALSILPAPSVRDGGGSHVSRRSRKSSSSSVSSERESHHSHRSERRSSHGAKEDSSRSYHSARSERSESTVKPSGSHYVSASGSKAGSTTTIKLVRPSQVELPKSMVSGASGSVRSGSVRASQVELPRSMVSGKGYEYAESVAPSDSVSSVGVKRERERLRERMRERY